MKKLSMSVGIIVILSVVAVPVLAITWGQPDTEHRYVGAMLAEYPEGPYQVCSGTLVHPRVFLTAGHCTEGWEGTGVDTFYVSFEQYALTAGSLREVERVITHPEYRWGPTSNPHDVGVLILKEPASDVGLANLPEEGFLDDLRDAGLLKHGQDRATFTLVGYGGTLEWPPPVIDYDDIRRYSVSEYRQLLKSWLRMSQNQATGDGGTCYGDSGGPAFWTDPDTGTETLVGITSWGDIPCVASAFNYRVDIPDTLEFIDFIIESLD